MSINCVTCNKCGWVHYAITREEAEQNVKTFCDYYDNADLETKKFFNSLNTSIIPDKYDRNELFRTYTVCMSCGNSYTNFRPSKAGDCPMGCTLNPILHFDE